MTASPYEARLDSLRRFLGGAQEGVLLSDEVNIGYFTGFFHSEGYLLVTQNSAALLVDFRYYEAAQRQAAGLVEVQRRRWMRSRFFRKP